MLPVFSYVNGRRIVLWDIPPCRYSIHTQRCNDSVSLVRTMRVVSIVSIMSIAHYAYQGASFGRSYQIQVILDDLCNRHCLVSAPWIVFRPGLLSDSLSLTRLLLYRHFQRCTFAARISGFQTYCPFLSASFTFSPQHCLPRCCSPNSCFCSTLQNNYVAFT